MALTAWFAPSMLPVYLHTLRVRVRRHRHGHTRRPGDAAAIIRSCIETCGTALLHGQPGALPHLLDARPLLLRPVARAARRRRAGARVARLCARDVGAAPQPRHHDDPPLRPPGGRLRLRGRLPAAARGRAPRGSGADDLVERHRDWLGREVAALRRRVVVDPQTGLVRTDRKFSAHRDTVVNRSNAYGNTMVALLAKTLGERPDWGLPRSACRPFRRRLRAIAARALLDRRPLSAMRSAPTRLSGEANLWPFYAGVEASPLMLRQALRYARGLRLHVDRCRCATRRSATRRRRSGSPATCCRTTRAARSGPASARCSCRSSGRVDPGRAADGIDAVHRAHRA